MAELKPDAVRSPLGYAGMGDSFSRLSTLQGAFAQLLQVSHVFVRHQGTEHFISPGPADTLHFPTFSPQAGRPRYEWHDRGDGVLYGYLRSDGPSDGI
jgi:hypothetical protein